MSDQGYDRIEGQFNTPPRPVVASGNFHYVQIAADGTLLVTSTGSTGASRYDSAADATSGVISAAAASLYQVVGYNASALTRFIQFYNVAAVPADGAVPFLCAIQAPGLNNFALTLPEAVLFGTGITWASSTTRTTKTITGVADVWLTAIYRT